MLSFHAYFCEVHKMDTAGPKEINAMSYTVELCGDKFKLCRGDRRLNLKTPYQCVHTLS